MKKLFGVLLVAVLILSGCQKKESNQLEAIKKEGTITIGTNAGYAPYEFHDTRNGKKELVGYDIDLGNAIAKELGVKAKFEEMEFDALIPSLQSSKFDIILAGMVDTKDRRKTVSFSEKYFQSETVAIAKKDKVNQLNDASKLKGKKIVAQTGSTQADSAKAIKGADVVEIPAVSDTIANLTSGKVDCLFIAEVVAKNIVKDNPEYAYSKIGGIEDALLIDGASVAMDKNQEPLKEEINKVIKKLQDNGELNKMFEKNVALYDEINKK